MSGAWSPCWVTRHFPCLCGDVILERARPLQMAAGSNQAAGKLPVATAASLLDTVVVTRRRRRMASFAFPSGGAPTSASLTVPPSCGATRMTSAAHTRTTRATAPPRPFSTSALPWWPAGAAAAAVGRLLLLRFPLGARLAMGFSFSSVRASVMCKRRAWDCTGIDHHTQPSMALAHVLAWSL